MLRFEKPEMEVITFTSDDVIVTSAPCIILDDGCNCDAYTACSPRDDKINN